VLKTGAHYKNDIVKMNGSRSMELSSSFLSISKVSEKYFKFCSADRANFSKQLLKPFEVLTKFRVSVNAFVVVRIINLLNTDLNETFAHLN